MSRSFVAKAENGKNFAKVRFNYDWDEYSVEIWVDGTLIREAEYFTSDFDDACETAKRMVN